jgi:hypothetical protein
MVFIGCLPSFFLVPAFFPWPGKSMRVNDHRARNLLYRLAVNRLRERRQSSAEVPTLAADD